MCIRSGPEWEEKYFSSSHIVEQTPAGPNGVLLGSYGRQAGDVPFPKLSKQPENISAYARSSSARSDTSFHSTSRSYTLSMQAPPLRHRTSSHIHPADLPDSCVSSAGNSLPACLVWPLIYHATSRYQRVVSAGVFRTTGYLSRNQASRQALYGHPRRWTLCHRHPLKNFPRRGNG